MLNKAEVGRLGEEIAENYLKKEGFKILERNWKTLRWGEVDIVARDKNDLVFIEVKTRQDDFFGKPFEAVNYYKIRTLVRCAHHYKLLFPQTPKPMRIDVVSIVLKVPPEIEYFRSVYAEDS